jgi:hypothetical protein
MKMNVLLIILLTVSITGNVLQFFFGVKIENNQSQIMQTISVNENHNGNVNINNTSLILSNANMQFITNEKGIVIAYPDISQSTKYTLTNFLAITNQTNYTTIGLIKK